MKDLFQTPDLIPANVQALFNEDGEHSYEELREIHEKCLLLGYSFDWYLDAEPFDLHNIKERKSELANEYKNYALMCHSIDERPLCFSNWEELFLTSLE